MNIQEYKDKLEEITREAMLKKQEAHKEFALSNAKFKKGDIIKGVSGIIQVDKITTYVGLYLPEAVYHGNALRKNLTPRIDGGREAIYGSTNIELIRSVE